MPLQRGMQKNKDCSFDAQSDAMKEESTPLHRPASAAAH